MGYACSTNNCSNDDQLAREQHEVNLSRLNLSRIEILDFEKRIKRFAHPVNRGRVTVDQLCTAFEDLDVFKQLRNPYSLVYKLLLSPFFRELPLSHYSKQEVPLIRDPYILSEAQQNDTNVNEHHRKTNSEAMVQQAAAQIN